MATFHVRITTGAKGAAVSHGAYIAREGRFTEARYGEVEERGQGNLPAWARENPKAFWKASDAHERANGTTYRELELALPRELSLAQQVALVQRFTEQELGDKRPYQWAIHAPEASDGREQPHVHLMFSDRQLDGIERGPEQFFKRYNAKQPEKGGAQKFSYGTTPTEARQAYVDIRERWAATQNRELERAGVEVRVDHRSLAEQGIRDREPGLHRGPAVSGIEARGEVSEVGQRQRAQQAERALAREAVVAEVREVTREELAAERVAVRERRELAKEVTGPERELVLPRVEADRREQLGRAGAMAERRVARRQGLGLGGRLGQKLIEQARALRTRIVEQLGRVKDWVREHFPDPLERLKGLARGRAGVELDRQALKATGRATLDQWRERLHERQALQKQAALEQAARVRAVEQFRQLAVSRETKRPGFGDRSEEWRVTPEKLRQRIDHYNTLAPAVRAQELERMAKEPTVVRDVQQAMALRHDHLKQLDRGIEL